jgi:thiamine biosynthesis protein ThiS
MWDSMKITVNGEQMTLDEPCTVAGLLAQCDMADAACAIEVNRALVPKREHADHELREGDAVELVTLVGGG